MKEIIKLYEIGIIKWKMKLKNDVKNKIARDRDSKMKNEVAK